MTEEVSRVAWQKPLMVLALEEFVLFPVWWYTRGLRLFLGSTMVRTMWGYQVSAVGVWMRNLFVPMYGDASVAGRVISFGLRVVMILVRGLGFLFWLVLQVIGVVVYMGILPASVLLFLYAVIRLYA